MDILAQLRGSDEWNQDGYVVGEPVWLLPLNNPGDRGKPWLANQIALDPEQTRALFDSLVQGEGVLQKMAEEKEAEERRALYKVNNLLLARARSR